MFSKYLRHYEILRYDTRGKLKERLLFPQGGFSQGWVIKYKSCLTLRLTGLDGPVMSPITQANRNTPKLYSTVGL